MVEAASKHYGFSMNTPISELEDSVISLLLYGSKGEKFKMRYDREFGKGEVMIAFEGIINNLKEI